ncbi:MAG: twin-arginine translocation signal domain-containing protein [Rhodospirillales bacterium]|jgi:hypothetical protein|nr:twin-arginine translocation signal domain-containing protein [Rhodospirillales bacterium]
MRCVDEERGKRGSGEHPGDVSRRRFLRHAGVGAGAVTLAAVGSAEALAASDAGRPDRTVAGYHETAHVRRVYQLSHF